MQSEGSGNYRDGIDELVAGVMGLETFADAQEVLDSLRMTILEHQLTRRGASYSEQEVQRLLLIADYIEGLCFEGSPWFEELPDDVSQEAISLAAEIYEHLARVVTERESLAREMRDEIGEDGSEPNELYLKSAVTYATGRFEANSSVMARRARFIPEVFKIHTLTEFRLGCHHLVALLLARRHSEVLSLAERLQKSKLSVLADVDAQNEPLLTEVFILLRLIQICTVTATYLKGETGAWELEDHFSRIDVLLSRCPLPFYGWLSSRLFCVLERMKSNSIWEQLTDKIGQEYTRAFADSFGTTELWDSQVAALKMGLLAQEHSGFVARLPTSAGKTLLADLAILQSLHKFPTLKCVYIAPTNALVNQVTNHLGRLMTAIRRSVAAVPGAADLIEISDDAASLHDVLVLTPEKLDMLVRRGNADILAANLFIFDEVHKVSSGPRGLLEELLIARLLFQRREQPPRVLFLSALMPNVGEMKSWIRTPAGLDHATSGRKNWRPARLMKGAVLTEVIDEVGPNGKERRSLRGQLSILSYRNTLKQGPVLWELTENKHTNFLDLGLTAAQFLKLGTVLVFRHSVDDVVKFCTKNSILLTKVLSEHVEDVNKDAKRRDQWEELRLVIEEAYGRSSDLYAAVSSGYAYHHASLAPVVKKKLERAISDGILKLVCCSPTLVEGFDSPVHTVIIDGLAQRRPKNGSWTDTEIKEMPTEDFENLIGRAGRALRETSGYVVIVKRKNDTLEDYLTETRTFRLESALVRLHQWLENPSEVLDIWGEQDQLMRRYLSSLLALSTSGVIQQDPQQFLEHTLHHIQHPSKTERIAKSTESIILRFLHDEHQIGENGLRVLGQTGLSPCGAKNLYDLARRLLEPKRLESFVAHHLVPCNLGPLVNELLKTDPDLYVPAKSPNDFSMVDHPKAVQHWLEGGHISAYDGSFILHENKKASLNFWTKYVETVIAYRGAWALSSFYAVFKQVAEEAEVWVNLPEEARRVLQFSSSYVKFGVNNEPATFLRLVGFPSRDLATRIGRELDFYFEHVGAHERSARFLAGLMKEWSFDGWGLSPATVAVTRAELLSIGTDTAPGVGWEARQATLKGAWIHNTSLGDDFRDGARVRLLREPENKHDNNAIRVHLGDHAIGYVDRDSAQALARRIDDGSDVLALLSRVDKDQPSAKICVLLGPDS